MSAENQTLEDLKKQIRSYPFRKGEAYVFVSYCNDHAKNTYTAWRDVLALRKQGYNVWLDEVDLGQTGGTWIEDIGPVIENEHCVMLMFYLSEGSIRSENCLQELEYTEKREDLSYVVIEAEEDIPKKIGQFFENQALKIIRTIHENEAEKQTRINTLKTLFKFEPFFGDGKNDRSRIPFPGSGDSALTEYYEKITQNNFPGSMLLQAHMEPVETSLSDEMINQKLEYDNGDYYVGEVKITEDTGKAIPHGIGKMHYATGYEYLGEWKDGQKDGIGKLIYPKKNRGQIVYYSGGWAHDKKQGIGLEVYNEKRETISYFGEWNDDKKNGQGYSCYKDGNANWDEWKKGNRPSKTQQK